ncbi:MAG: recombinase family protein [Dissulfurispiraceae bacterium]|jgi:DNA invertase Pin-like site-specific DNA recombinase
MRTALYVRVSTQGEDQDPELQLKPMRKYCIARFMTIAGEYIDIGQSGAKDSRPELNLLMEVARKRQIDCILVWKIDRFGSSQKHLVTLLEELKGTGVAAISYKENIKLSTASGRLQMSILSTMAEFEREFLEERVKTVIAQARDKEIKISRKGIAPTQRKQIIETAEQRPDLSIRELAKRVKQSRTAVFKTLLNFRAGKYDKDGCLYEPPICL